MKHNLNSYNLEEVKIEVTHNCPLACVHCSSSANPSNVKEIPKDKCIDIINDCINMGVKKIAFSGGEPLVWKYIDDAIEVASKGVIDIAIYTTGNIQDIENKLFSLYKKGLKKAIFSIYSPVSKEHEYITRRTGSFEMTKNAIITANQIGIQTEIHFVAMSGNYKLLNSVAEFGKNLGVSSVSVLRFVPQGRGALLPNGVLNRYQNVELKKIILELRNKGYNIRTGSPYNFLMVNDDPKCLSAINKVIIDPELNIFPCDAFKNILSEELVGTSEYSTLENATLNECWQNSEYFEAIRNYLSTDFTEQCASCRMLKKCSSGCLAQKVLKNGTLKKDKDPCCIMS
jgi:radical SAM protein with 4Fe4S-binding SPASM domain